MQGHPDNDTLYPVSTVDGDISPGHLYGLYGKVIDLRDILIFSMLMYCAQQLHSGFPGHVAWVDFS